MWDDTENGIESETAGALYERQPPALRTSNGVSGDMPPLPEPATLEAMIDVDAWLAQREPMIAQLQQRRAHLLEEITQTERNLELLGAPVRAPNQSTKEEAPRATTKAARPLSRKSRAKASKPPSPGTASTNHERSLALVAVMTKKGEPVAVIGRRAGMAYDDAWKAMNTAHKAGLVKRTANGRTVFWSI